MGPFKACLKICYVSLKSKLGGICSFIESFTLPLDKAFLWRLVGDTNRDLCIKKVSVGL